ncbi:hypothetical protein CYY_001729 [Polysphondylium violaceum]|uniref:EF-hand domain-containing protein n=1 Tax=Polysphondylium violaceum TaxID=133409 RepID=A0A8J4PXU0_9MYCE|nr:hypothetical protein CYY_001729 [Polysphondylium violaceum]
MTSYSHIKNLIEEQVQGFFSKLDTDHNGEVTYEECIDYWRGQGVQDPEYITDVIFLQNDKNKDTKISVDEFRKEANKLKIALAFNRVHELNLATFLSQFDKNSDDKITLDELESEYKRIGYMNPKAAARWIFISMDKNKDDTVTMDDLTNLFKKKKGVKPQQ